VKEAAEVVIEDDDEDMEEEHVDILLKIASGETDIPTAKREAAQTAVSEWQVKKKAKKGKGRSGG